MLSGHSNLANVASHYVKILNVTIPKTTVVKGIENSPHYPSLYCLTSLFDKFKIPNQAFRVTATDLPAITTPFVSYVTTTHATDDFVLVTRIASGVVHFISDGQATRQMTLEDFAKLFKNVVFVAEPNENSGDPEYAATVREEKKRLLRSQLTLGGSVLVLLMACFLFISDGFSENLLSVANLTSILLIKFLGIVIIVLLLIYEIDRSNDFVKNICSAGKKTSCSMVLNSQASTILGFSWSELGTYYFFSTTLFLLSPVMPHPLKLGLIAAGSFVVSPYIAFSLFYQWRVLKKWCTLCLLVQAALLLELIWATVNFHSAQNLAANFSSKVFLVGSICVFSPMVIWNVIKPLLIKAKSSSELEAKYNRILLSPEIFSASIQLQQDIPEGWQNLGIDLGNPSARNTIIKVCNPYCSPCAKAHPVLEEIINNNSDYKLKVIFTSADSVYDLGGVVVKHLMAIAATGNQEHTKKSLDDWYLNSPKDYKAFASRNPIHDQTDQSINVQAMHRWCQGARIEYTPSIFLNGKRLPENYTLENLKSILG